MGDFYSIGTQRAAAKQISIISKCERLYKGTFYIYSTFKTKVLYNKIKKVFLKIDATQYLHKITAEISSFH